MAMRGVDFKWWALSLQSSFTWVDLKETDFEFGLSIPIFEFSDFVKLCRYDGFFLSMLATSVYPYLSLCSTWILSNLFFFFPVITFLFLLGSSSYFSVSEMIRPLFDIRYLMIEIQLGIAGLIRRKSWFLLFSWTSDFISFGSCGIGELSRNLCTGFCFIRV